MALRSRGSPEGSIWPLRVPIVLMCLFYLVTSERILEEIVRWLAWVLPTTLSVCVALLIMSIWRPARPFTGILLCIVGVLSFLVNVFINGGILSLSWGWALASGLGIVTVGVGWIVANMIIAIIRGGWTMLAANVIWLVIDVLAVVIGWLLLRFGAEQQED